MRAVERRISLEYIEIYRSEGGDAPTPEEYSIREERETEANKFRGEDVKDRNDDGGGEADFSLIRQQLMRLR